MLEIKMQELKQGNKTALEFIYNETSSLVFSICLSYVKKRPVAEDMMQDTYIKVIRYIKRYQDNTNPKAWIVTIAKNTCLNKIKKDKKIVYQDPEDFNDEYSNEGHRKDTPLLDLAKQKLKPKELQIVLLHIVDNMKLIDIAKVLNKRPSSVRWSYNNSLSKLRKIISKGGYYEKEDN